jgi:hypothetical protein
MDRGDSICAHFIETTMIDLPNRILLQTSRPPSYTQLEPEPLLPPLQYWG